MKWGAVYLAGVVAATVPGAGSVLADERIEHHDLIVRLDPARHALSVEDRIDITGGGRVVLRLAPGLSVAELTIDGRRPRTLSGDAGWSIDLGADGRHRIAMRYAGVFDPKAGGHLQVGGAGTYLAAGGGWIPTLGNDRFTYRMVVEAPTPYRIVVPGRIIEEDIAAGYRAVVESEAPTDGIVLVAGIYAVRERRHGDIALRTSFDPRISDLAEGYLESSATFIETYAKAIGPYPFSRFDIVSGPHPVGLGFPGMTYMGTRVLALPFIRHRSLRHEVLHNWWGNGVTVDYSGGNWAEGLTTYMADYAAAEERSADAARDMRLSWLRDYAALPAARDHAVVEFVGKRHDAAQVIGYNKVAFIFHMLRRDIGDAAFGRAQRDIWRSHRFRAASWSDLRRTFAAAAGRDLSRFFAQWLERTGAPRLRLEGAKAVRFGDGHTVTLDLAQDFPAFSLTLPVTILTDQGAEHFTVRMDTPQSRHTMSTRGRPTGLAIDAGFDVFRRLDPAEAPPILRDVTLDGKTMTIIAGDDAGVRKAARRLAERLLDTAPRYGDSAAAASSGAPLLVIGRRAAVAAFLGRAGLDGAPPRIASRGKARAWAARHANRRYLVVEIDDMAAFPAVIRALPHFGSRGYVVMDKDGAIDRGAWPASGGPLQVDFRP